MCWSSFSPNGRCSILGMARKLREIEKELLLESVGVRSIQP